MIGARQERKWGGGGGSRKGGGGGMWRIYLRNLSMTNNILLCFFFLVIRVEKSSDMFLKFII